MIGRIVCSSWILALVLTGHALAGDFWSKIGKAKQDCCGDYVGGFCCDDYCLKPPPCPVFVDCFVCDDYCYKCPPCVPLVSCFTCDDYCPKCPPAPTCPPKHLFQCGPAQDCCPTYTGPKKGTVEKPKTAGVIRLPAVRLPVVWTTPE